MTDVTVELPYTVDTNWVYGSPFYTQMEIWCMEQWGYPFTWCYTKAGVWTFAHPEQAVAFALRWKD